MYSTIQYEAATASTVAESGADPHVQLDFHMHAGRQDGLSLFGGSRGVAVDPSIADSLSFRAVSRPPLQEHPSNLGRHQYRAYLLAPVAY